MPNELFKLTKEQQKLVNFQTHQMATSYTAFDKEQAALESLKDEVDAAEITNKMFLKRLLSDQAAEAAGITAEDMDKIVQSVNEELANDPSKKDWLVVDSMAMERSALLADGIQCIQYQGHPDQRPPLIVEPSAGMRKGDVIVCGDRVSRGTSLAGLIMADLESRGFSPTGRALREQKPEVKVVTPQDVDRMNAAAAKRARKAQRGW